MNSFCNTVFVIVMQIKLVVVVVVVPGISSRKRQKVDVIKSQLSFVDCFTAQA